MNIYYKLYSACFVVMMSFSSVSAESLDRGFRFEVGNAVLAALPGQPGVLDVAKGRDVSSPITVVACVDANSVAIVLKDPADGSSKANLAISPGQCGSVRGTYFRIGLSDAWSSKVAKREAYEESFKAH